MRLKKSNNNKEENIVFRCSEKEKNLIRSKANIYTEGNLSEFILYAALNFIPDKSDFDTKKPSDKAARKK